MIVLDDVGFAEIGCFGGLGGRIKTPNIDQLANRGVRYNNFHTFPLCSPTRASLLTGRNPHSVGMGMVVERATGFPGYNARIPPKVRMLPAILGANGYNTMAVGKWHLAPAEHLTPVGPFDRWPLGQGFERFYGFLLGMADQWNPPLIEDNHRVDRPVYSDGRTYHLSEDLVDHAVRWIQEQKAISPSRPFLQYLAFGAGHAPHHVARSWADPYKGVFAAGWDTIREETLALQIEMGLVPSTTRLPARNEGVRPWSEYSVDERRVLTRQMEVYAGFLSHTDHQIGRLLDFLDSSGDSEKTMVVFLSDNGASAEGGPGGLLNFTSYRNGVPEALQDQLDHLDDWGGPSTAPHYATGWAMAGNTPNRWYKTFVHEGGTRTPLIVAWPGHIADPGSLRTQFHTVPDVTPTLIDAIGADARIASTKFDGTSFAYTFQDRAHPTRKPFQYFETFGHRAMWSGGWKAVTLHWASGLSALLGPITRETHDGDFEADVWELYHLDSDYSESTDLATDNPTKLKELVDMWWSEASQNQVLPLDDRRANRLFLGAPTLVETRARYDYFGTSRMEPPASPMVLNRTHKISASVHSSGAGADGVIVADGGRDGGYVLCVWAGRLCYVTNYMGREHHVVRATTVLPSGPTTVEVDVIHQADGSATVSLAIGGEHAGKGSIPRSNPVSYGPRTMGLHVGWDEAGVWPSYTPPFKFNGTIDRLSIDLGAPQNEVAGTDDDSWLIVQ